MSFIWPVMLISLLMLPLFVALYLAVQWRRRRLAARYGGFGLAQASGGEALGLRRHLPPAIFLAGLAILLVALARPQTAVSLPRVEGTVILVFDVSGSMAADDVQPTRMEAAKTTAREFVARQPSGVQVGVVAFSDSGFTVQTPTDDQQAILATIDRLSPQRGTSLAYGIFAALNTIAGNPQTAPQQEGNAPENLPTPPPAPQQTYPSAVIVLLTDGENNVPPDPFAAAQTAAEYGVRVFTVGIGSAAGATLNIEGFNVHSQLDEATLQAIAQLSGGKYFRAENEADLQAIYTGITPRLVVKEEKMEVTSLFAGASIFALLVGGLLSLLWFSRLP